jgi:YHS domain-containing protein
MKRIRNPIGLSTSKVCLIVLILNAPPSYSQTAHPGGFWKCRATSSASGEFNNEDPVGLAGHAHIPTDCVLNTSDGHGKIYCFSSRPSLEEFEDNTSEVLEKAQAFWGQSHVQPSQ